MFNFTNILRQTLLAFALGVTSIAAHAGVIPTYTVTINTAAASGLGYLDFDFAKLPGAPAATATISNLTGAVFTVDTMLDAQTTDLGPNSFAMLNENGYRSLITQLGGAFTFNLSFSGDFLSTEFPDASVLKVWIFDEFSQPVGNAPAVIFNLFSPNNGAPASVDYSVALGLGNVAEVAEVPEPSELLLVLSGLAMVGLLRRRRASAK